MCPKLFVDLKRKLALEPSSDCDTRCISPASCATMNRQAEFDELDRNRRRMLDFVFLVAGTPKDDEHKRHLQKASLSAETEEVLNDFDGEDNAQSSPTRHSQDLQASKKPISKHGISREHYPMRLQN
jgi:hypothetical protein